MPAARPVERRTSCDQISIGCDTKRFNERNADTLGIQKCMNEMMNYMNCNKYKPIEMMNEMMNSIVSDPLVNTT